MESPEIMDDETFRLRRFPERFGKGREKAGRLHHRGKV